MLNARRKQVDRPSREELKKLIRSTPYVQIGRLSDNAVRKWVKSYNLPHKVSDIKAYSDKDWELSLKHCFLDAEVARSSRVISTIFI